MLLPVGALAVVFGSAVLQIKQPPAQQRKYAYHHRQYKDNGSVSHFY
jgi:hypothetical protein